MNRDGAPRRKITMVVQQEDICETCRFFQGNFGLDVIKRLLRKKHWT
jgi:hypothetical protein